MGHIGAKHKVVTDIIWRQAGRVPAGGVNLMGSPHQMFSSDVPYMQIAIVDQCIRIAQPQFVEWLSRPLSPYQESHPIVMDKLKRNPGVSSLKATIGAGAGVHSSPDVKVLDFDVKKIPELQQLLDNSTPASMQAQTSNVVLLRP